MIRIRRGVALSWPLSAQSYRCATLEKKMRIVWKYGARWWYNDEERSERDEEWQWRRWLISGGSGQGQKDEKSGDEWREVRGSEEKVGVGTKSGSKRKA